MAADPARYEEAIAAFRKRVPMPRDEWDELEQSQREYAFTVSGVAQAEMVSQVWDAIDSAVANGEDLEAFKDRIGDALIESWGGATPGRLENVFRTNITKTYNAGRRTIFTAPAVKEARPYWRFELIDDDRTCDICGACGGVILPADDPWWDTHIGPLHGKCRCGFTAVTREEAEDEGISAKAPGDASDPADGYGDEPTTDGTDWTPTMGDYAKPVRDVLRDEID
jgi:SPP1 gp7 family putative phage head morphogenesis protein